MNKARVLNRMGEAQIRAIADCLGPNVKVVHGKFVVNLPYKGEAAVLAGGCRGDDLTDRPEGCEAIAATIIVIPHVGVQLPPGTSLEWFMRNGSSLFATEDVAEALTALK